MKAMLLREIATLAQNPTPLSYEDLPEPKIDAGEVLIRVTACGVCHTELDEIEGRMKPRLPIVLGHQVVGKILESDSSLSDVQQRAVALQKGQRVGVAWIASACGACPQCLVGQ